MNEHLPRSERSDTLNAQEMLNLADRNGIRYLSPSEQSAEEMPQHKFEITDGHQVVGGAEIDYFSTPLPLYQLTDLWVDERYANQGNASRIMDEAEAFLKARRKPGILVDAIIEGSPAQGMYERRGWKPLADESGLFVYNWPQNVSLNVLKGYSARQTPLYERES